MDEHARTCARLQARRAYEAAMFLAWAAYNDAQSEDAAREAAGDYRAAQAAAWAAYQARLEEIEVPCQTPAR